MKPVVLTLPPAHPKQYELINAFELYKDQGVRFVAGACGTKFGKTYGCTIRLVFEAWNNRDPYKNVPLSGPGMYWWVAPSYAQSKMAYNLIKRLLPPDSFQEYKADLQLCLLNPDGSERSWIHFKSGDNPDTLRGYAVNFFIIDEAARIPYESFVSVMTTVTQTRGRGIVISTPKGRGWFADVYHRGEKSNYDGTPRFDAEHPDPFPEWTAIRMPTWTNPHVSVESIEEMKRNLPSDVFQQEVAAEFLDDSAGVFRGVKDCIRGSFEEYKPGHNYVIGVDLAKHRDYTVLVCMDMNTKQVVAFDRFNKIDWNLQQVRIVDMARAYRATVWVDSTGVGDAIYENLSYSGIRVEPYKIGGTTAKQQLIEKLRINIEKARISFPGIYQLVDELRNYEYKITDTGVVRYSAPSGQHDDCVVALALANWGADRQPFVYRYRNVRGV